MLTTYHNPYSQHVRRVTSLLEAGQIPYKPITVALDQWYPPDLSYRARIDQWLDWNQTRLAVPVKDIVLNKVFLGKAADQEAIRKGFSHLNERVPILEAALTGKQSLCGVEATIADLSVASNMTQLQMANAMPDSDAICDWYDRMCRIDGFRNTLPRF